MKKEDQVTKRRNNEKRICTNNSAVKSQHNTQLWGETKKPTISAPASNSPLSVTDRTSNQKAIKKCN